ncbi:MAG: hypothetical protein KDD19_17620 [Phaeodactylibacter sp.]|nr:hypothetical protein [Phaeodactylibacter sp.]
MPLNPRFQALFFGLLLCITMTYTSYRAATLSMTHDESTSYNWFHDTNVATCFYSKDCWYNANNHLLNTWGWQRTTRLLGVSEWTMRLPNLLAHLLYLLCSLAIVRAVAPRFWVGMAGLALINFNPYLLEFFGLARGYGLSAGLSMASILALFLFLRNNRWPALLASYLLAALAVLANFVALNYLASLWGTVFLLSLFRQGAQPGKLGFRWQQQLWMNTIPIVLCILLAVLLYRPIQFLHGTGDFDSYGTSSFVAAFRSVVENSLYGARYFAKDTVFVFTILYTIAIVPALAGAFWFFFRAPEQNWRQQYLATALLFLLSSIVMTVQHHVLGSNYLEGRKALLFISLSGLLFFFLLHGLAEMYFRPRLADVLAALFAVLAVYHLARAGNLDYSREWWYDKNTREMILYLNTTVPPENAPVELGVADMFQPTTSFYQQAWEVKVFTPPFYSSEIHTDGRFDFYYVFDSQIPLLEEKYEVEKRFTGGQSLLRKRDKIW